MPPTYNWRVCNQWSSNKFLEEDVIIQPSVRMSVNVTQFSDTQLHQIGNECELVWEVINHLPLRWQLPSQSTVVDGIARNNVSHVYVETPHIVVKLDGKPIIPDTDYENNLRVAGLYDVVIPNVTTGTPESRLGVLLSIRSDDVSVSFFLAILDEDLNIHVWCDEDGIRAYHNRNRDRTLLCGEPAGGGMWARPRFHMAECHGRRRDCHQRVWPADANLTIDEIYPGMTYVFPEGIQLICVVDRSTGVVIVEIPPDGEDDVMWIETSGQVITRTRRPVAQHEVTELLAMARQMYLTEDAWVDRQGHVCTHPRMPTYVECESSPLVRGYISRLRGEEDSSDVEVAWGGRGGE